MKTTIQSTCQEIAELLDKIEYKYREHMGEETPRKDHGEYVPIYEMIIFLQKAFHLALEQEKKITPS